MQMGSSHMANMKQGSQFASNTQQYVTPYTNQGQNIQQNSMGRQMYSNAPVSHLNIPSTQQRHYVMGHSPMRNEQIQNVGVPMQHVQKEMQQNMRNQQSFAKSYHDNPNMKYKRDVPSDESEEFFRP